MSADTKDIVTDLLNTVQAIVESNLARNYTEVGQAIGETPQAISDWVSQRRKRPNGEAALKLFNYATEKTLQLAKVGTTTRQGRALHGAFRAAYRKACELYPVNGNNGKAE